MPFGSLRARVLIGFVLWSAGLLAVSHVVLLWLSAHFPGIRWVIHSVLLLATAIACMVAGFVQVRRGLAPFQWLRGRLATVRDGSADRLEGQYPAEVQPLVHDLNSMLEHNEQAVRRALAQAGDLAHGLKTPLAVLAHEAERLREAGHPDAAAAISQQVERMQRQLDYHLAHARAAASGATPGARCVVLESASGLARTLSRLHADRGVVIDLDIARDHVVRGRREDVDEMLGNLLDNACKWARSRVRAESRVADGLVRIAVEDDGPGLDPSMRDAVLQRGVRADQAAPGTGLGLAIVRDLAELHGGAIALDASPLGGLRATLTLKAQA
jgi:signal transduction histidine kinase